MLVSHLYLLIIYPLSFLHFHFWYTGIKLVSCKIWSHFFFFSADLCFLIEEFTNKERLFLCLKTFFVLNKCVIASLSLISSFSLQLMDFSSDMLWFFCCLNVVCFFFFHFYLQWKSYVPFWSYIKLTFFFKKMEAYLSLLSFRNTKRFQHHCVFDFKNFMFIYF